MEQLEGITHHNIDTFPMDVWEIFKQRIPEHCRYIPDDIEIIKGLDKKVKRPDNL
jgi:hypothetical protein